MTRGIHSQAHPAGIWTDLSIDGPVIGELVVIVDRGKNLPNRKTLGKQDPYCVIRLGKEACRTDADKRGGQTPKWDKELRFKVRDSPDYRSLKLTCFNEDKKTELIGECMIKLDKVLQEGGGRDDGWRQLNCKGKYAGEIMLELTFWDIREKKKEPKAESRSRNSGEDFEDEQEYINGPRALSGVGIVAAAKREKEREKRRQRDAERMKQRQREKMGLGRDLPSEPNLLDPTGEKTKEKEREKEKLRANREKSKEIIHPHKKSSRAKQHTSYEDDSSREERRVKERHRRRRETVTGRREEYVSRDHRKSRKSLPTQYHFGSSLDLSTMQQNGSRVDLTMQQHGSMVDLRMRDSSPGPGRMAPSPIPTPNDGGQYAEYDSYDAAGHMSGGEVVGYDDEYAADGYASQNDMYMQKNTSQVFPQNQPMPITGPDGYVMDPPPPPPHRSMQGVPTQQQVMALNRQPSHSGLKYQQSENMKHRPSQQLRHQQSVQLAHQPSVQGLRHQASQQRLIHQPNQQLRHKPSMSADWSLQTVDRSTSFNSRHSFDGREFPPALPLQTHFKNFSSPNLAQEPDFKKLEAPHAPYLDEFDDSGRYSQPSSPQLRATANGQESDALNTITLPSGNNSGSEAARAVSGYGTSSNVGALVPAGYNYGDAPPYGRRGSGFGVSDSGNYSQALVTTSGNQQPPVVHTPTSRRNSYLGDPPMIKDGIIIPPSLVPGIEPAAAEELRQLLEEERRKGKYAAPSADAIQHQSSTFVHSPPAPYVEDVNDREDGGRRRSAAPGAPSGPTVPPGAPPPMIKPRPLSPAKGELSLRSQRIYNQHQEVNAMNATALPLTTFAVGRTDSKLSLTRSDPSTYTSTSASVTASSPAAAALPLQDNSLVAPELPKRLAGTPFSPEAYNTLNPRAQNANFTGKGNGTIKRQPAPSAVVQAMMLKPGSNNRVLKMDDILTPESYAPEPEKKGAPPIENKSAGTLRVKSNARPPGYSASVSKPNIPTRGSSKMLALTSSRRDDRPPPPPAHQALTIVNNNITGTNRSGTMRDKHQRLQPMKSSSSFTTQQQQNLAAQIAAHEAKVQREREQAEREQQMQLALQQQQIYANASSTRSRYLENRWSIAAPPSQPSLPPPPEYGGEDEQSAVAGDAGTIVLHRHRSAEETWNINHSRPISYDNSRPSSSYNSYGGSSGGYDTGMVLYRGPTGAAAPRERDSYYGSGNRGSFRGRERGISAPPPAPLGMSMENHSQNSLSKSSGGANFPQERPGAGYAGWQAHGNGQLDGGYAGYEAEVSSGKALMSREDWLLQEEMKGISIGPGSYTKVFSGGSGGTLARRGRYY